MAWFLLHEVQLLFPLIAVDWLLWVQLDLGNVSQDDRLYDTHELSDSFAVEGHTPSIIWGL